MDYSGGFFSQESGGCGGCGVGSIAAKWPLRKYLRDTRTNGWRRNKLFSFLRSNRDSSIARTGKVGAGRETCRGGEAGCVKGFRAERDESKLMNIK